MTNTALERPAITLPVWQFLTSGRRGVNKKPWETNFWRQSFEFHGASFHHELYHRWSRLTIWEQVVVEARFKCCVDYGWETGVPTQVSWYHAHTQTGWGEKERKAGVAPMRVENMTNDINHNNIISSHVSKRKAFFKSCQSECCVWELFGSMRHKIYRTSFEVKISVKVVSDLFRKHCVCTQKQMCEENEAWDEKKKVSRAK